MAHLKSLTFTVAPQQLARNPKLVRRQRLIYRLEEQQKLVADPAFTFRMRDCRALIVTARNSCSTS